MNTFVEVCVCVCVHLHVWIVENSKNELNMELIYIIHITQIIFFRILIFVF